MSSRPKTDVRAGARLLVKWMADPDMSLSDLGYALDLWVVITGHGTNAEGDERDAAYEAGLDAAVDLAHRLANPPPKPTSEVVVTDVEVTAVEFIDGPGEIVQGEVVQGEIVL